MLAVAVALGACLPATGDGPPSQSRDDARRDGVVPALASVTATLRITPLAEVEANEGTWMLSRPSDELIEATAEDGCTLGDSNGSSPLERICTDEYGEILLIDADKEIVRAFPMPGAVPSWLHLTEQAVYAGRIGDGGLPDSTLVRIDRDSREATVILFPHDRQGGLREEWPSSWHRATAGMSALYRTMVGFAPEVNGVAVTSWIGEVLVDLDGIERLLAEAAPSFGVAVPRTHD